MQKKCFIKWGMFSLLLVVLVACSHSKDSNSQNNAAVTKEVDRICDSVLSSTQLPGMIVGIWSEEKGFSYLKGKGYANLSTHEAMSTNGVFRIGSNTKTFTVTCILQLVDEHKLSLSDTIGKFFPGIKNGGLITVRMLCNMTSGIPNYTTVKKFADSFMYNPTKKWMPQELVDIALDTVFTTPGAEVHYSNTNTVMLGMIVEQLTGKPLAENFQQRFFSTINMPHTIFATGTSVPAGCVRGYYNLHDSSSYTDDVTEYYDASWLWGTGCLISNISDVKAWVENLVNGTQVSAGLQSQRFEGGAPDIAPGVVYGLGMFTRGHDMWGHNGGLPGFTSIMMHHRSKKITYVILYNWQNHPGLPDSLFKRLLPVVNPEI